MNLPTPASDTPADASPDDRTLHTSRRLDASPERVWQALADPAQLARWWGPDGFTNEFGRFDFRAGGHWDFWMVGPDGRRYWNENRFVTLDAPRHFEVAHVLAPVFTLTIRLAPEAGGTRLDWAQCFETAELARGVAAVCGPANEQNLDRLEAVLASTA